MNWERKIVTFVGSAAGIVAGYLAANPSPKLQLWAQLLTLLAGLCGGKEYMASSVQKTEAKARLSIPPAMMLLALLPLLATQPACNSLPDAPAAETLKALDQVCAVRAENREATDAAAKLADQEVRQSGGVAEQPSAGAEVPPSDSGAPAVPATGEHPPEGQAQ